MANGEVRDLLAVDLQWVVVVMDAEGHFLRLEPAGTDRVMWPFGENLERKVADKQQELDQEQEQG